MKIYLPDVSPVLPVHPSTGLQAIGIGKRGPIWPVVGGSEDGDDAGGDDDTDDSSDGVDDADDQGGDAGADQLGDAGKKALDAMKAKWQGSRDRAKVAETKLAEAERLRIAAEARVAALTKPTPAVDVDKGKPDVQADKEPAAQKEQIDPDKLRAEAKEAARSEVIRERALDKVEAKAAKLFADPEDARALLAHMVDKFIDNGQIDVDEIESQLADLLKKKPHLAAQSARRFNGGADGGARNGKTGPQQITDQELSRMTPQQIVKAREDGRLTTLLGGAT